MDLISVIVPVYNVQKYLKQCIDSIINQTYKNLEIILVDDGSTDNCAEICDDYAKKDDRIKVIHQKNQGLSMARNNGLEIAKGKYIGFIDSDDYIELDMYQMLYNLKKKNQADVSVIGINRIYEDTGKKEKIEKNNYTKEIEKEEAFSIMVDDERTFRVAAWNKLYLKEVIENVRYPKQKLYEDVGTTYKIIDKAQKIVFCTCPKYNYRIREKSITKNKKFTQKEMDRVEMAIEMTNFIKSKYPNLKKQMDIYLLRNYIATLNKMILDDKEDKDFINETEKVFRKNQLNIVTSNLKTKKKVQFLLLSISSKLYAKILKKCK